MGRRNDGDDEDESNDNSSSSNDERWDSYETRDLDDDKIERKDKK